MVLRVWLFVVACLFGRVLGCCCFVCVCVLVYVSGVVCLCVRLLARLLACLFGWLRLLVYVFDCVFGVACLFV